MSNVISCTRRIQFCSGHRVNRHESKCRNLHGHNYVVWFEAVPDVTQILPGDPDANRSANPFQLDDLGRVVDFAVLKTVLGSWIDQHWDHGFILDEADREAVEAVRAMGEDQKLFLLPYNPTAENLARYLLMTVAPLVLDGTGARLVRVTVDETENCSATVTRE